MVGVRRRFGLAATALLATLWTTALLTAPVAAAPRVAALTYAGGALICHQQPARSFHLDGAQYPVCARCMGLYVGAVLGVLGWCVIAGVKSAPSARGRRIVANDWLRRALVVVAMPTLVSVALAWMGVWDGTNVVRAVFAVPLGAVVALILAAVAARDLR